MKKFLLTIVATVLLAGNLSAQGVARECVLFEVFTGVNCSYCPGAAASISQLVQDGKAIAPVAFHTSAFSVPQFYTTETTTRATYYNISSYPTVKVDGVLSPSMSGSAGNQQAVQQAYNQGLNAYNQRMSVPSPFSIDLSFDYHSGTQCQAKAVVTKVGECDGEDVRVFIVMTESHIPYSWYGGSEVNSVCRDIVTPAAGVSVTEDTQEITGLFSVAGYKKQNLNLIAWVQNYEGDREIYQTVMIPIVEDGESQFDMGIINAEEVPAESCSGRITPRLTFQNYGAITLNSVLFTITDDANNELGSYQWEGNLAQNATDEILFDEIDFADAAYVKITASNLNGSNQDQYDFDNYFVFNAVTPNNIPEGYLKFQLRIGDDPQNFSIEIENMDTDEIVQTYTFEEADHNYQEIYNLPEYGCYRITFKNAEGNGIGEGYWGIKDKQNQTIVMGSRYENVFKYEYPLEVRFSDEGVESIYDMNNVDIYPNPAQSFINVVANNISKVSVYNAVGQMIYSQDVNASFAKISSESWANGLYYVNVETTDGKVSSQKVVVNK